MIKVFEVQHQVDNIESHQSRIVEFEDFREYLQNVNERSLPIKYEILNKKFVNHEEQTVTFRFLHGLGNEWFEFVHFAKVIE